MRGLLLCGLLACIGCGDSTPTAPTPQIPIVSGSYAGTVTITWPEIGRSLTCPATTTVTQTGPAISMAPLVLSGQCGNVSVPLGDGDIDTNGSLGNETGTTRDPSCGTYNYTASGGFFGRTFQFSMAATSATCLNFNLTGTLTR